MTASKASQSRGVAGFDPDWVIHPGETLREWREENHLSEKAAATCCGRMTLHDYRFIEEGRREISPEIAARLEYGTQIPARLWLRLEKTFRDGLKAGKTWTR